MRKRWCVYLAVLLASIGLYMALPGWLSWIVVLTAAGSPLASVAMSIVSKEADALGLFRLPGDARCREYVQELRPYRPGDSFSRVHWKQKAKTGRLTVREERILTLPKPPQKMRGILPVALCFGVLFCVFPPGRYGQQMRALQDLFQRPPEVRFDLTVGPWSPNQQAVMDVVASKSQMLYLRGRAYDTYDGQSWQAAELEEVWSVVDSECAGTVAIATRKAEEQCYFPYYTQAKLEQGQLRNPDGLREYTFTQAAAAQSGKPSKAYLQLPEETKAWAEPLAEGKTVAQIQAFVRGCAQYDPNVAAMPPGADFARWFIQESGKGYCVHFATAAVVLLRAAGIPARFVTGYAVAVQAGVRKTVVGSDAHAWAEYWDGGVWRILESTPTAEAVLLPEETTAAAENESRRLSGGVWVLILAVLAQELALRKYVRVGENGRLKELRQKAAFSRYGLNEEEKREMRDILGVLRKPRRERKGSAVKQDEKKPITWEVADPKPPIIQSGKMESRKKN
jgi:hypothetical protein